jgi:MYXO-CTERM domain-containing protein
VGYSLQRDGSAQLALDDVRPIAARAFEAWSDVDCGAGSPSILAAPLADVACARAEYVEDGPNANVVVFRDAAWPYPASAALALTTVTYVLDSGAIRDADLEINTADATLTTSDTSVEVDLESILTHEAGHVLGLAHSSAEGATMVTDYPPQSLVLRTLEADDAAAICAAYPPGEKRLCDATPRNGLGTTCNGGEGGGADTDPGDDDSGCAIASTAGHASRRGLVLAVAIAASALARRRRP